MTDDRTAPTGGDRDPPFGAGAFREIYHSVNDAILVHDAETGAIIDVNETACEMYGFTRSEARDLTVEDLSSGRPPHTAAVADRLERAAAGEPQVFEWRTEDADGTPFWVEISMRRAAVDEGTLVLVIVRDESDRKERERELRTLTEEYETIFENAGDAVFLIDVAPGGPEPTFRFERLNPAHEEMTGITTADVRGKTPREAFGDDLGAELAANYRRCVEAGEPITYEEELPLPEGRIVSQTKLVPVLVDGEVTRIVGIARDVTDRVEREREVQQQNERLEEFASVVSHDLRNPLNVAQGRAELLEEECESDHVEPAVDALDRMEAIIEDTLTLARKGETVAETEPIAITDLADECWRTVETEGATLEVVDEFTIRGDRERLRHVLENLFRNGVEHGSTGSRQAADDSVERDDADVTVRVGRIDTNGIYVEDDGSGIPADKRERVFEPGYTSASEGTGFGLPIVKRIAEAHGWDVTVTEGAAGGARFEFTGVDVE
ncbi:MAG: PAS domain S-box protein [Haloferacaceae archaeon]